MASESARATSAAESRFRINAPNSRPRRIRIIALDAASADALKPLAANGPPSRQFLTAAWTRSAPRAASMDGWLRDLAGDAANLQEAVAGADAVVMVATAGQDLQAAPLIGECCALNGVMATAVVLDSGAAGDSAVTETLGLLRPHCAMLVIAGGIDYLDDMLAALRA